MQINYSVLLYRPCCRPVYMEPETLQDPENTRTTKVFSQATPFASLSGVEFYWTLETSQIWTYTQFHSEHMRHKPPAVTARNSVNGNNSKEHSPSGAEVAHLVEKFLAFYRIRRFVTVSTRSRHWCLSSAIHLYHPNQYKITFNFTPTPLQFMLWK